MPIDIKRLFWFAVVSCSVNATTASYAAPPEVTSLTPAGGQQGTTVKVALQGKVDPEKLQLWCDRPGVELVGPDGKDAVQLKIAADVPPGWCWLGFYNAEGAAAQRPFYIGTVPELREDEPNNRLSEANKIEATPAVCNGVLQKSGDVDTWSVTLSAGQTLVAALTAKGQLDSPVDALLQLVDARGFVVQQSDDVAGFDPQLAFTAKTDGVYAIRVFGFPATPDSTIRFAGGANYVYRLGVTTGPLVARVWSPAVTAQQPTRVKAEGWSLPAEAEFDVPALVPGVQEVNSPWGLSTARVWAVAMPVMVSTAEISGAKPQATAVPMCVVGRIDSPRADDGWKFAAKKDEKIALRATARALGSPLDVVLKIVDAAGKTLQEVDDAVQGEVDVALDFNPPQDGEYTAIVRDRFAHGGTDYIYAMTLGPVEPDFALSVANDAYTFTPGVDFELPVSVAVQGGFDDAVQISVDGLPEGCTAEPVTFEPPAPAEGATKRKSRRGTPTPSVKLVIKTTKADGWAGTFRVVGRTQEDTPRERIAVGKPPNTDLPRPTLRAVIQVKPAT